ncbi:MAG: APC family permease [Legionellaceae bacterium]
MLKRDISTTNILIASAGGMIGSGWLFSPFISAQIAGSNALVSWVIAAIFMVFIALPLCELGTMFPVAGGMSNYPTFTHGQDVGFLFAWTAWLSYVVMTPIEIQAILQYASYYVPGLVVGQLALSWYGYLTAAAIMFLVVLLNSYGIKLLVECNKYASIIKFILPGIAIVSLIHHSPTFHNLQLSLGDRSSWSDIASALSTGGIVFAFTGFQNGLMLAGEVKSPQKSIPIAILGAVLIGFLIYFMLQLSFIVAVPEAYLMHGWHALAYPGDTGPLVGLTLLLGLGWVATLLMIDSVLSPFGTTFIYTAATSRILYGMAVNHHLPEVFLKVNRHKIPYVTLYVNFFVGLLSFLPFSGWQKLVAFLSSTSILSYGIGPICCLAMRTLQPSMKRPFYMPMAHLMCHLAFYFCNVMLYWCGFSTVWKLDVALVVGLLIYLIYHRQGIAGHRLPLIWFIVYMSLLLILSFLGSFGGLGLLIFPYDVLLIIPFSVLMLLGSQAVIRGKAHDFSLSQFDSSVDVINS